MRCQCEKSYSVPKERLEAAPGIGKWRMRIPNLFLLSVLLILISAHSAGSREETDAYLWLEEIEGQKALNWARKMSQSTLAVLKARPEFEQTYQSVLDILNSDKRIAYPRFRGEYLYNFWKDDKYERGLWRRATLAEYFKPSPQWEILLDIDKLSEEEGEKWVYKGNAGLYPDYTRYIVYLSRGGGDARVAREFDAGSKQFVTEGFNLPEAKSSLSWKDLNTIYVGTDLRR
jgi:prolyl oligopeptidase